MFHSPVITQFAEKAQRGILSEVVFGNPQSGCRNMGVCKVHIGPRAVVTPNDVETSGCSCNKGIAFLRPNGKKEMHIHFMNYSLSARQYKKYFPGDCFVVEAPYSLPRALCRALGYGEASLAIQPGTYPALNDGMYHTVSVNIY